VRVAGRNRPEDREQHEHDDERRPKGAIDQPTTSPKDGDHGATMGS
jgi:hypothetical protein